VEVSIDKPASAVRITAPTVERALSLFNTLSSLSGRASCVMDSISALGTESPQNDVDAVLNPPKFRSLETRQKMRVARLKFLRTKRVKKPAKPKPVKTHGHASVRGSVADKKKGAGSAIVS
jgi:hypothetical protein